MASGREGPNDFVFVNVSKSSRATKKASSISSNARAFVRRNEWASRRRRAEEAENPGSGSGIQEGCLVDVRAASQLDRAPQTSSIACGRQRPLGSDINARPALLCAARSSGGASRSSLQTPVAGLVDPFGNLSATTGAGNLSILRYYVQAIMPFTVRVRPNPESLPLFEIQRRNHWMALVLNTPSLYHATFCLAALQLSVKHPQSLPMGSNVAARHRVDAIRAVQENLATQNSAVSDENIAAVFTLVCFERNVYNLAPPGAILVPGLAQLQAHRNGLDEMIARRGGFSGISTNNMLQLMVSRHTATQMIGPIPSTCSAPKSVTIPIPKGFPGSSQFFDSAKTMSEKLQKAGFNTSLVNLAKCVDCLLQDTRAWTQAPDSHNFNMDDIDYIHLCLIRDIRQWHMDTAESGTLSSAEGLVGIASAHTVALSYRDSYLVSRICRSAVIPWISKGLSDPDVMDTLHAAKLDVWVTFMLLALTCGFDELQEHLWTNWYTAIARTSRLQPIEDFQDLKKLLQSSLWDPEFDILAHLVWEETRRDMIGWDLPHDIGIRGIQASRKLFQLTASITLSDPYHNSSSRRDLSLY